MAITGRVDTTLLTQAESGFSASKNTLDSDLTTYAEDLKAKVEAGSLTVEEAKQDISNYYEKVYTPKLADARDTFDEKFKEADLKLKETSWKDWKKKNSINGFFDIKKGKFGVGVNISGIKKRIQEFGYSYNDNKSWSENLSRMSINITKRMTDAQLMYDEGVMPKSEYDKIDWSSPMTAYKTIMSNVDGKYRLDNYDSSSPAGKWKAKHGGYYTTKEYYKSKFQKANEKLMQFDMMKNYPGLKPMFETSRSGRYNHPNTMMMTDDLVRLVRDQDKAMLDSHETMLKDSLGPKWEYDSRMTNYLNQGKLPAVGESLAEGNPLFDIHSSKYKQFATDSIAHGVYNSKTKQWTVNKPNSSRPGWVNMLSGDGMLSIIKDIGKVALKSAFNIVTAPFEAPVAIVEGIDDIIDGDKSVGTALWDMTKDSFGVTDIENMVDDFNDGNYLDVYFGAQSFAADQQGGGVLQTDTAEMGDNASNIIAEGIFDAAAETDDGLIGDLKDDINEDILEPALEATGIVPPSEEETTPTGSGGTVDTKDIDTLKSLKSLLGIMDGDRKGALIDALLGAERDSSGFFKEPEVEKLAENTDIIDVMQQQRQVADTGYDVGERETLSGKTRRELAGRARASGMAAGAAAGGLRGASVGSQARSLAEAALQKQADVTTEMDKASIARKDAARQDLAKLATDVTSFDIKQAEELKKRKGATAIGVQSLISQEDMMKKQLELAAKG